jgi:hypothetical protein
VVSKVDAYISEKNAVYIFKAELTRLGSRGLIEDLRSLPFPHPQILFESYTSGPCHFSPEDGDNMFPETLAPTYEDTWHQNRRQHQYYMVKYKLPIQKM